MIINNSFSVNNLSYVVIIGETPLIQQIIDINKKLKLKTILITSLDQSKIINNKIKYKIINRFNNDFKKFVKEKVEIEKTLFVSLGSRIVFKKKDIEFFKGNLINFHGTRLPLDAGAGTQSWKIMREDRIDTQLAHIIDEGIDTGGILDYELSIYPSECKIPAEYEKFRLGKFKTFYKKIVSDIKNKKKFYLKNQINFSGRYNPRLNTIENGFINWNLNSYDLYNFINAFDDPYSGASTYLNNGKFGKLFLKSVHLHGGDSSNHPYMSGIVSRHDKDWIVVSTKSKHTLLIEDVLDKKGNNVIKNIKVGDRFYTPYQELEKSKTTRTIVNFKGFKN